MTMPSASPVWLHPMRPNPAAPVASARIELRDHQIEAVTKAAPLLAAGALRRGILTMACGTGKTLTSAAIADQLGAHTTLVVAPTLTLLTQQAHAWARYLGSQLTTVIAVCSEPQVLKSLAGPRCLVTTDPHSLAYMVPQQPTQGRTLVVATYHSQHTIAAAHQAGLPRWPLIVADEAHCTTSTRRDSRWSLLHHDNHIPADRRLYVTATPRVAKVRQAYKQNDDRRSHDIASMDNPDVYGPGLHSLSVGRAIEQGILSDYIAVLGVVDDDDIARLIGSRTVVHVNGYDVTASMLAAQISFIKACAAHQVRSALTFHSGVGNARTFAATLPIALELIPKHERPTRPVRAYHLNGTSSLQERDHVLKHLGAPEGALVVVSSADLLNQGVDVPAVDGVGLIDASESQIKTVQRLGRGLRLKPEGPDRAMFFAPIWLSNHADAAIATEADTPFRTAWQMIAGLRAHDSRVAADLDARYAARQRTAAKGQEPLQQQLPPWLRIQGETEKVDEAFASAVLARTVGATASPWDATYLLLKQFHTEYGHCHVPASSGLTTSTGASLASWVGYIRRQYVANDRRLTATRRALLEEVGIDEPSPNDLWGRVVRAIEMSPATPLDPQLKMRLRISRANGHLTKEKQQYLREHGIDIDPPRGYDLQIERVREFLDEYGHLSVSSESADLEERATATRLSKLRRAFGRRQLSSSQEKTLWDMGAIRAPKEYALIRALVEARKPLTTLSIETRTWLSNSLSCAARGETSLERTRLLLDALGTLDFSLNDYQWGLTLESVVAQKGSMHSRSKEFQWLFSQRKRWGSLTDMQRRRLRQVGVYPGCDLSAFRRPRCARTEKKSTQ
ncbi:DEAD/DEAH box helicase family protein [Nocardiopsis synnemataformans]|uniref:helicase associated domain-containing protein n=1 Tax=Nocardiopsis synnemataformans TaxID=61305 RepID=UPI003EC15355